METINSAVINNVSLNGFNYRRHVGFYYLDGFHFAVYTKPFWFNRLMVRLVLGWKWRDA